MRPLAPSVVPLAHIPAQLFDFALDGAYLMNAGKGHRHTSTTTGMDSTISATLALRCRRRSSRRGEPALSAPLSATAISERDVFQRQRQRLYRRRQVKIHTPSASGQTCADRRYRDTASLCQRTARGWSRHQYCGQLIWAASHQRRSTATAVDQTATGAEA